MLIYIYTYICIEFYIQLKKKILLLKTLKIIFNRTREKNIE